MSIISSENPSNHKSLNSRRFMLPSDKYMKQFVPSDYREVYGHGEVNDISTSASLRTYQTGSTPYAMKQPGYIHATPEMMYHVQEMKQRRKQHTMQKLENKHELTSPMHGRLFAHMMPIAGKKIYAEEQMTNGYCNGAFY